MRVTHAQLPDATRSADRVFVGRNAVLVLDGASAFVPVPVSAATYADALGTQLLAQLDATPDADLRDVLQRAIREVADALELHPGEAPSSTVTVLREGSEDIDLLILGDSPAVLGVAGETKLFSDERLAALDLPEREEYRARLLAGSGFDDTHAGILASLQRHQAKYRNRPGGYWIAEAEPSAAQHALCRSFRRTTLNWAVLATDGASDAMRFLKLDDWRKLVDLSEARLRAVLARCADWEVGTDADGRLRPRAKQQDDKTLAVVRLDA